jgi:putative oxidoreductase
MESIIELSETTTSIPALQKWTARLGRFGLGAIFLMSGLGKLGNLHGTADMMRGAHMPAVPLFLAGAITFEVLGGLSVITGVKARWGALALIVFLIPATLIFHNFWAYQGAEQQMQMVNFLKNVSIGGGLLYLYSTLTSTSKD